MMELEFRWNASQGIYFAIKRYGPSGEHVFAADPKIMHTEELWIEWAKLVADFLVGKGEKVRAADIITVVRSHFQSTQVDENGFTEETSTVGGLDGGRAGQPRGDADLFLHGTQPADRPTPWQYSTAPAADADSSVNGADGAPPADGDGDKHG